MRIILRFSYRQSIHRLWLAGFTAWITAVLANTANSKAHGGTIARSPKADSHSATLRCHDPNGELYIVNFSRQ